VILRCCAFIVLVTLLACVRYSSQTLAWTNGSNAQPVGGFRAGFARVDITPPPGAGLMGWGSEGIAAVGHRQRLFARAMYLEDGNGGQIALVSLDVGESSIVLHRKVALELARSGLAIGTDRIFLSATHTHSGPSHFFGMPAFDEVGSAVSGYDSVLTDTLVSRITGSILEARRVAQPARAAWGMIPIWGLTRIRSWPAYDRNDESIRASLNSRFAPIGGLTREEAGVDPTFSMLRVDVWDPATHAYRRQGAFSIFAIHGTIVSSGQRFYDSDVQGRVATLMEQYIDPAPVPYDPRAVYLFVNGGEGDVSPNIDPRTRCPTPRLVRNSSMGSPRVMNFETTWRIVPRDTLRDAVCIPLGLSELDRIAKGIVAHAQVLYESLGHQLRDNLRIGSAFATLHSADVDPGSSLCEPKEGVTTVVGAPDGWTRFRWDWKLLFTDSTTYPPFPSTAGSVGTSRCQSPKRILLWPAQFLIAGPHSLPRDVELGLVSVGPATVAFIPGEPTSNSAWVIRRAAATALFGARSSADTVQIVSLTNGYIQYVSTAGEYPLQFYEGSATIYGPNELAVLATTFSELGRRLAVSTRSLIDPGGINAWWKGSSSIVQWDEPATAHPWTDFATEIGDASVKVRWTGSAPSAFYDRKGPAIVFERQVANWWIPVAWDNMPSIEVEIQRMNHGLAAYKVIWKASMPDRTNLRLRLRQRGGDACRLLSTGASMAC
jgi:neutral ceramidase